MEQNDLRSLKGVGPSLESKLNNLDIFKQTDLLFHLPSKYEDRTFITKIGALESDAEAQVEGEILISSMVFRGRRMLMVQISDGTGIMALRFFTFNKYQKDALKKGSILRCFGKTRKTTTGIEMIHPNYEILDPKKKRALPKTLTPVYPTTQGLSQGKLRSLISQALNNKLDNIEDLLPSKIAAELNLGPLDDALIETHSPKKESLTINELSPAKKRLVTEELIANQIGMRKIKRASKKQSAIPLTQAEMKERLISKLPFKLTESQKKVSSQISYDMALNQPMMRLLQGDVGSGKTVVAGLAMATAVDSGFQSALMAPTELLAEQHKQNLDEWFGPLGVKTGLLKSKLKAPEKRILKESILNGDCQIIIGTHALFQESIEYHNLALVIVDEQHRFGVEQRFSLINKAKRDGVVPHQLIMTATPIPRTLAMTAYGDLDNSIISELPGGRGEIATLCLSEDKRGEVVEKTLREIKKGRQVYWVCPLIEESEDHNRESAEATFKTLSGNLKEHRIGLVHGKLSADKKNKAMSEFKEHKLDLLVATTVIEVGVDVPNASMMVIENTERLGLSQLHQLRGRIGRGEHESFCIMLYKNPLGQTAKERLKVIRSSRDGFLISEKDLELRGPGEILGIRQKGVVGLKIADISRDAYLIPKINKVCDQFESDFPEESEKLVKRWIGNQINYRNV